MTIWGLFAFDPTLWWLSYSFHTTWYQESRVPTETRYLFCLVTRITARWVTPRGTFVILTWKLFIAWLLTRRTIPDTTFPIAGMFTTISHFLTFCLACKFFRTRHLLPPAFYVTQYLRAATLLFNHLKTRATFSSVTTFYANMTSWTSQWFPTCISACRSSYCTF